MIKIYILTQAKENDLLFKFASSSLGFSGLFIQIGGKEGKNGNPYIVYKNELRNWLEKSNISINQTELVVCDIVSGNI